MSTHYKPDIEQLRRIVPTVYSWRALALALGLTYPSCTIYRKIRPLCNAHQIDTSHFLGQASRRGKEFPKEKRDIQVYLSNEQPINSHKLKLRLLKEGLKQRKCEVCGLTEWMGHPIPIQLHHLDGNSANNILTNLQIICPNCHAQTNTYCAKNRNTIILSSNWVTDEQICKLIPLSFTIAELLREAGLSLAQGHYVRVRRIMNKHPELKFKKKTPHKRNPNADPYWRIRPKPEKRKYQRPTKEELERLVWEKPSEQVAKDLGIGGTLLCRWCKDYAVEKPPRGYWSRRAAGETHAQAIKQYIPPVKQIQKRLTDEQVIEILRLLEQGNLTLRSIGKQFNVRHQSIMDIRDNKTYKHVLRKTGSPTENFAHDVHLEKVVD